MKPRAVRDGYLGDLIDRHNMLWNKFVWLENLSQKHRKGQPKRHINGSTLDRYVNLHKKGHGWDYMISGMDAQSIQATIQRREVAFDKFFKYAKAKSEGKPVDKKESPPKFKRIKGAGSFTMKQTGWRIGNDSITIGNFIKKNLHEYRFWDSRPLEGKPKTMTVRRDALGDLWLHVVTDAMPSSPLPKTGIDAGFDFGSDPFLMDSHGRKWKAPCVYFKHLAEVKKIDRRIARCVKGSNSQKRLYKEMSRLFRDIDNLRSDWQWKLAWELCRTYDVLCFENLDLADMGKRHKDKEKGLSPDEKKTLKKWRRKLKDYAPAAFIEKVKWVAQKTGKEVLIVPSKWDPTSQKCHFCKAINPEIKNVKIKKWKCPSCGAHLHRDINAAINAEVDAKAGAAKKDRKESKGTRGCAGGASSVDVGQSGDSARESRWARIRKSSKPQGGDAGLAEGNLHGTQTHDGGLAGGIPHALAVGECQTFEIPWHQKADIGRVKVMLEEGGCFDYSVQNEGAFFRIQYWSEDILLRWKDKN